jgi:hypothetical protein
LKCAHTVGSSAIRLMFCVVLQCVMTIPPTPSQHWFSTVAQIDAVHFLLVDVEVATKSVDSALRDASRQLDRNAAKSLSDIVPDLARILPAFFNFHSVQCNAIFNIDDRSYR